MPSGGKPKAYDPELVSRVAALYAAGHTQSEIAELIGSTQKIVWNLMRRHGLKTRVPAKRNQRGSNNHMWKGDSAKYAALHLRVQSYRGAPSLCEHCGTTQSPRFEWASVSKRYEDIHDYVRLCASCHHVFDGHVKNLGAYAQRKEVRR